MEDLLTTRQLQEILQIDRVTIYRMLEDGRLRGFKVGGQWRFSRHDIEAWLQSHRQSKSLSDAEPGQDTSAATLSDPLPLACIQAIQGIFAEACEVAAITLSTDGTPLTEMSCPCKFCQLILSTPEARRQCLDSWQSFVKRQDSSTQTYRCHAGLQYISEAIKVSEQPAAFILAGQFVTEPFPSDEQRANIKELAYSCGIDPSDLNETAGQVSVRTPEGVARISRLVKRTADTFAEIGRERSLLLKRLQQIAEMTVLD